MNQRRRTPSHRRPATVTPIREVLDEIMRRRPGSCTAATLKDLAPHGLDIAARKACQVISPVEAEEADAVIAGISPYHPDDLTRACDGGCGRPVFWRPHAPIQPPKLCPWCALDRIRKEDAAKLS
ncbi:MAG TPA: hypothetical protein VK689_19225 [Armatimonadota bacterium]|nr:hypothetical protein [Armatimonadota bacterium]